MCSYMVRPRVTVIGNTGHIYTHYGLVPVFGLCRVF